MNKYNQENVADGREERGYPLQTTKRCRGRRIEQRCMGDCSVFHLRDLKKPIAWLLILSLARMPVPWVHRHRDLKPAELEQHLVAYHETMPELDLVDGWHVHFLRRSGTPGGEGLNTPKSQNEPTLQKSKQTYLENDSRVCWLGRVELRGQHATANLATLIEAGNSASQRSLSHAYWYDQHTPVDTCALFCVYLI